MKNGSRRSAASRSMLSNCARVPVDQRSRMHAASSSPFGADSRTYRPDHQCYFPIRPARGIEPARHREPQSGVVSGHCRHLPRRNGAAKRSRRTLLTLRRTGRITTHRGREPRQHAFHAKGPARGLDTPDNGRNTGRAPVRSSGPQRRAADRRARPKLRRASVADDLTRRRHGAAHLQPFSMGGFARPQHDGSRARRPWISPNRVLGRARRPLSRFSA